MAHRFLYEATHRILLTEVTGEASSGELLEALDEIAMIAESRPIVAGVSDLTAVTAYKSEPAEIKAAARGRMPYRSESTPRYYVSTADYVLGMLHIYRASAPEVGRFMHIVPTLSDALDALGAADARFEPIDKPPRPRRRTPQGTSSAG